MKDKTQAPAPAQPVMPGRDWLEGMVDAWRTNAAEHEGEGRYTSAEAFRICAADLDRALVDLMKFKPAPAHKRLPFEEWFTNRFSNPDDFCYDWCKEAWEAGQENK